MRGQDEEEGGGRMSQQVAGRDQSQIMATNHSPTTAQSFTVAIHAVRCTPLVRDLPVYKLCKTQYYAISINAWR